VTDNQMTTAICEDLARKNLAPGRSYPDSGYLSAALVVSALTTRRRRPPACSRAVVKFLRSGLDEPL
jgi:hypothetical protein